MKKIPTLILMTMVSVVFISGCGKREKPEGDRKILAKIDNYEMTVADFKAEAGAVIDNKELSDDPAKAKEELLDELITRKVLLGEAQRQDFDKDRAFMKEIERYWEQALLKLLYHKKSKDLLGGIKVEEREVTEEYKRLVEAHPDIAKEPPEEVFAELRQDLRNMKLRKAIDAWVSGLRSRAKIKIDAGELAGIDIE